MYKRLWSLAVILGLTLLCWADVPGPPVNQDIGMLDTDAIGNLEEADCRVCHSSGVPDRHHLLYGQPLPDGSAVPYPEFGTDGEYNCLICHGSDIVVERDCTVCHAGGSPHHTGQAAVERHCTACHGDLVDDFDDGHYIPTYEASLVTPWQGLNGDGYANAPYPTFDLASDGSGTVTPSDVTQTEAGPPYFSINSTPLDTVQTRNQPNTLFYKPAGFNNDFYIGSTHHGGEQYSVVFTAGSPLAASWDAESQTLSVTIAPTQTALELVNTINAATGEVDVEAVLGYDGEDPIADLLPPEHYEPLGGDPPNNRGFGAGSCSYCHDHDGNLDVNGDPAPISIVNNHDTHHHIGLPFFVSDGAGGSWRRCNVCHNYTDRAAPDPATYGDQSGPAFDLHIRICEECHGPDSLHNIQADSNGDGVVVVGGEDAGYGHVGRDGGPGNSDCWGCHGFRAGSASATAPFSGPVIPTLYRADAAVVKSGRDTTLLLTGAAFKNTADGTEFESDVLLTAADGTSVTLTPDIIVDQEAMAVTIPGDTAPGNYRLQAAKSRGDGNSDVKSNPVVISVIPEVTIRKATARRGSVTIVGTGFGGYAKGSGTSVTGAGGRGAGSEATIISWSDTKIRASFRSRTPKAVTVRSVFGTDTIEIDRIKNSGLSERSRR